MALSSCPDCGREVSTRARQCVHCGRPWPASTCGSACGLLIGVVIAVAVLGGVLVAKKNCTMRTDALRCRSTPAIRCEQPAPAPMAAPVESKDAPKAEQPKPEATPPKQEE
jgi:hypothetical protein